MLIQKWETLSAIARADFLERVRRSSFVIVILVALALAYSFIPPANSDYITFDLGGFRGLYNSAYISIVFVMLVCTVVTFPVFYLVKNTIERDTRTGVGQILATTPLTRVDYVLGKFLSNLLLLLTLLGVFMLMALVMQFVRGESDQVNVWGLFSPFLFLAAPAMALVAGLAVLFETIPFLRGGLGNFVYFILYIAVISFPIPGIEQGNFFIGDPFGLNAALVNIISGCEAAFSGCAADAGKALNLGLSEAPEVMRIFNWDGMTWTIDLLAWRILWLLVGVMFAIVSAGFFHRFDPARENTARKRKMVKSPAVEVIEENTTTRMDPDQPMMSVPRLTPLSAEDRGGSRTLAILVAELQLMLHGQRWWWWAVLGGLVLVGLLAPDHAVQRFLLAAAWIWPLMVWSRTGSRENLYHTQGVVFSAPAPVWRQIPVTFLAGLLLAWASGAGGVVYALQAPFGLLGWLAVAAFIPALALACGVWTGGTRLFEMLYVLWWYMGLMNSVPGFDVINAPTPLTPAIYLLLSAGLVVCQN